MDEATAMADDISIHHAARAIAAAEALIIGAGAGMGVDSGMPDFRGDHGFWKAYPPFARLGLRFIDLANPRWFTADPALAWGFYGHRLNLYRAAVPHAGFTVLRRWAERMKQAAFVFTSNVDGHFQRAGFPAEHVLEIHGSIHHLQCLARCGIGIFPADGCSVTVDETTFRATGALPTCPSCGGLARPNILMFGDFGWDGSAAAERHQRLQKWLNDPTRLVVIECGAGTAIPSVRDFCEDLAQSRAATLIRVNPREPQVPAGHIGLAMAARPALEAIDERLRCLGMGVETIALPERVASLGSGKPP